MVDDDRPVRLEPGLLETARWLEEQERRREEREADAPQGHPWDGHDIDAMLRRVEMNAVAYGHFEVMTVLFDSRADLGHWLQRAWSDTPAAFDVYDVDVDSLPPATPGDRVLLVRHELTPGRELAVSYVPQPVGPDIPAEDWFAGPRGRGIVPVVDVVYDGNQVESYVSDYCAPFDGVRAHFRDEATERDGPRWFGIHVHGTTTLLVLPQATTVLRAAFDLDGASVHLSARPWQKRIPELQAEVAFREKWRAWYDTSVPLDPEDASSTLDRLHAEVRSRLDEETRA